MPLRCNMCALQQSSSTIKTGEMPIINLNGINQTSVIWNQYSNNVIMNVDLIIF